MSGTNYLDCNKMSPSGRASYSRCTTIDKHRVDPKDRLSRVHLQTTKIAGSSEKGRGGRGYGSDLRDYTTPMTER